MSKENHNKNDEKMIILEQWKSMIEMSAVLSKRRDTMNKLFITLNLGLIAAITQESFHKKLILIVFGFFFSITWNIFLKNMAKLQGARFSMVRILEKNLPKRPYHYEKVKLFGGNKGKIPHSTLKVLFHNSKIFFYNIKAFLYNIKIFFINSKLGAFLRKIKNFFINSKSRTQKQSQKAKNININKKRPYKKYKYMTGAVMEKMFPTLFFIVYIVLFIAFIKEPL